MAKASDNTQKNRFAIGVASTLVGATLWGFSGSCIQYLNVHYSFPPLLLTCARMLGSGVLFLLLMLSRPRYREQLALVVHDSVSLLRLVAFGCVGLFACQLLYIVTIGYTNAGTATVLESFCIVICMAVTCVLARRLPRAAEVGGLVCALIATVLIATGGDLSSMSIVPEGLFFGLLSAVAAAFYIMYPRRLFDQWGSLMTTGLGMLIGGVCACAVWAVTVVAGLAADPVSPVLPSLDAVGFGVLALVVVVGTFGAFGLYLHGISIVGGALGTQLGAIEPVSATVFAAFWLGTAFTGADWIALVLMVVTIFLVSKQGEAGKERKAN